MQTMIDELFDRSYQAGRAELNAAIFNFVRRLGASLSNPFKVLNRIEYSAPWSVGSKRARSH